MGLLTRVHSLLVPSDDSGKDLPAPSAPYSHFNIDSTIVLSRELAEMGIYPGIFFSYLFTFISYHL